MNDNQINTTEGGDKQFGTAISDALKKFTGSPEMKKIEEINQKMKETIPAALAQFAQAIEPYVRILNEAVAEIAPYLIKFAEVTCRLAVIYRLGHVEYVAWRDFPESFYEHASRLQTDGELVEYVYGWLQDNKFMDIEEALKKIQEDYHIGNNPVFVQAWSAYKRGDYDLAMLGFTAMIDRLLSEYTDLITSTNIKNRVQKLSEKIEKYGEYSLESLEMNDYILINTYFNAIEKFGENSRFDKEEPELNRHWLMHGRTERCMEQIDCIRVINILYGTILLGEMENNSLKSN